MINHNYFKLLRNFSITLGFGLGLFLGLYARSAFASPGTRAVAEAAQRTYYEVKALGTKATPAQIKAIGERNSGPAYATLQRERNEQFRAGAKHANDKSKVVSPSKTVPLSQALIKDEKDSGTKKSRSISSSKSSAQPNFEYRGSGHATSVDFGIAPKK